MICPHCSVSIPSGTWKEIKIYAQHNWHSSIQHFYCTECTQYSVKFIKYISHIPFSNAHPPNLHQRSPNTYYEEFITPKSIPRDSIPKNVEDIYRHDYDAAVKLLPIDANASAAYSRRVLQHYIEKKLQIKKSDLQQEIKELKKLNMYTPQLLDMFDDIRHYGIFATHAKTNQITGEIIGVDFEESESLLDILEELFEYDYALPSRIKERKKKLQEKLRDSKSSQNESK